MKKKKPKKKKQTKQKTMSHDNLAKELAQKYGPQVFNDMKLLNIPSFEEFKKNREKYTANLQQVSNINDNYLNHMNHNSAPIYNQDLDYEKFFI